MSVNGITSNQTTSYSYTAAAAKSTAAKSTASPSETAGAVYEPSADSTKASVKKTYTPDTGLINQLKADAETRTQQLRNLVAQMMGKQANAYGKANDIWSFLSSGNYTVDPVTKAKAQADIAEDGYWGVEQTSSRIIDFATALTGGDPEKIEEMRDAFKKGFAQAQKTWGGKLPDISQKTYEAVLSKFDRLAEEAGLSTQKAE